MADSPPSLRGVHFPGGRGVSIQFSNNVSLPIPRADFLGYAPSLLPFFVFPNRIGSLELACVTGWIVIRGLLSFFTAGTI